MILVKLERLDSLNLMVEAAWAGFWEIERPAKVVRKRLKAAEVAVTDFGFVPESAAKVPTEVWQSPAT